MNKSSPEYFQTGDIPLKDVVLASNAIFKKMATEQVQYEEDLKSYLDSDSALYTMIYKDFPHLQVKSVTNLFYVRGTKRHSNQRRKSLMAK